MSYADEQFVTSDAIALKTLEYASVLGRHDTTDVISLPTVDEQGGLRTVEVLIGPASQLTSVEDDTPPVQIPDEQAKLAELDRRIAAVGLHKPVASPEDPRTLPSPPSSPSTFDPDLDVS